MIEYYTPSMGAGAGSQPAEEDGATLDILQLPDEMQTYAMPELPDSDKMEGLTEAVAVLMQLKEKLNSMEPGCSIDITDLDEPNRELIDQILGEGEVSAVFETTSEARIQESVLAGVWRVKCLDEHGIIAKDTIEVACIPSLVAKNTFRHADRRVDANSESLPEGVLNAPPLLTEINDKVAECRPGSSPHVINLTLLPQTEADLAFLNDRLGKGPVTILSRGYGNCRITSTSVQHVWWVQYFNSQDANILNTLEICGVPEVAKAAVEDIRDSAERLGEILEACL